MDVVPEVDGRVKRLKQPEKVKQQDALHLGHGSVHLVQLREAATISVFSSWGGLHMRHLSTHLQAEAAHIADSEVEAVMDLRGTTSKVIMALVQRGGRNEPGPKMGPCGWR